MSQSSLCLGTEYTWCKWKEWHKLWEWTWKQPLQSGFSFCYFSVWGGGWGVGGVSWNTFHLSDWPGTRVSYHAQLQFIPIIAVFIARKWIQGFTNARQVTYHKVIFPVSNCWMYSKRYLSLLFSPIRGEIWDQEKKILNSCLFSRTIQIDLFLDNWGFEIYNLSQLCQYQPHYSLISTYLIATKNSQIGVKKKNLCFVTIRKDCPLWKQMIFHYDDVYLLLLHC